jgi:hypothetical protein
MTALAESYWKHRRDPVGWLNTHPVTRADLIHIAGWVHKRHPHQSLEWVWIGILCGWSRRNTVDPSSALNYLYPTEATIRRLTDLLRPYPKVLELGSGRGLWAAILQQRLPDCRYRATDSYMYGQSHHYTHVWRISDVCAVAQYDAPVVLYIFPGADAYRIPLILGLMHHLQMMVLVTYIPLPRLREICGKVHITQHHFTDSLCYGDLWDNRRRAVEKLTVTSPHRAHLYSIHIQKKPGKTSV